MIVRSDADREADEMLATRIECVMMTIDSMAYDLPRLIEARDALEERISYNESAMTLIIAMGGQYDSTEDKVKLNLLDLMIQMISVRSEGFKEVMNAKAVSEKNRGLLKSMFGV